MFKRRILYAFTLVVSIFFYIFYSPWFSWYLFVFLLLLIPFDLIISIRGMLNKTVLLSVPPFLEKDADGVLIISTVHKKSFPVRAICVKLCVTGDDFTAKCTILCSAEEEDRSEVTVDTSRTGLTVFKVEQLRVISLIGLISLKTKPDIRASVLILPPPIKQENTIALPRGLILRPKPGGGFSEEHDLRNYRQGDPVRSIHWKISAKFDSLIIREPLVPPHHSRLVHVMKWDGTEERDSILGHLRWVSSYLLKWEMPFYIRFGDDTLISEIKHEANLIDFLRDALDRTAHKKTTYESVPTRFTWVYRVDVGRREKGRLGTLIPEERKCLGDA